MSSTVSHDSTPLYRPNVCDDPRSRIRKEICAKLDELESQKKIFFSYDIIELSNHSTKGKEGAHIAEFISKKLSKIITHGLENLADGNIRNLICHAFFADVDNVRKLWRRCALPLFSGLLIGFISKEMAKKLFAAHEPDLADKFTSIQREFDVKCFEVLDSCFHVNEELALRALQIDYNHVIYSSSYHNARIELLDLANMGKSKKFISHPLSQKVITMRWQKDFKVGGYMFLAYFFFPFIFLFDYNFPTGLKLRPTKQQIYFYSFTDRTRDARTDSRKAMPREIEEKHKKDRPCLLYSSVNSKFIIHSTVRACYLLLFSYSLLAKKTRPKHFIRLSYSEMAVIFWQLSYLVEMCGEIMNLTTKARARPPLCLQFSSFGSRDANENRNKQNFLQVCFAPAWSWFEDLKHGVAEWRKNHTVDFIRNSIIVSNIIFILIGLLSVKSLRLLTVIFLPLGDAAYYLSFIFASIRALRVLSVTSFFGPIVLMIKKMITITVKFFVVFIFFWTTYAIVQISISGGHEGGYSNLPWLLFIAGAFEIFGEVETEQRNGILAECPTVTNWHNPTDTEVMCLFKTSMIPSMLFLYMVTASVLLVNLLTAMLTKTYEDISKDSNIYWKYKLYDRLVEYEKKLWLPAPLSLLYYFLRVITSILDFALSTILRRRNFTYLTDLIHFFQGRQEYQCVLEDADFEEKEAIHFVKKQINKEDKNINVYLKTRTLRKKKLFILSRNRSTR